MCVCLCIYFLQRIPNSMHIMKHPKIYTFTLSIIYSFNCLQSLTQECTLDMTSDMAWPNPNTTGGNWGGFLIDTTCTQPFQTYLYALAKQANKTGQIFLNTTQQRVCLSKLSINEKKNVSNCGIEKLTIGNGDCSDYTLTDVVFKQGSELHELEEQCKSLGSDVECGSCSSTWNRMFTRKEADICRFTVLIALMSKWVDKREWLEATYSCLGSGMTNHAKEREKTITSGVKVLIGGVGAVLLIAAIVLLILFKMRIRKTTVRGVGAGDNLSSQDCSSVRICLEEVHLATDNLSASNFIGQGVAGKVYKGVLSNGQHVAVKHIINDGHMETFVREVTSLSHVKHPNLVELLGHYDGGEESFLVYELCHNGNLSEWIFGKDKFLTWIQRLEIAINCAKALWFLHTYIEGCIVHRDIKPTNILLDADFQAKLSDFGLSKVLNKELSYVSSEVRGTLGYVDPEYQKNRHVHSSSDVYSFGVVLLQLLSGQRVINLDETRPMPLSKMAKNLRKGGDIKEFADPKLHGDYSAEAFQLVLKLALCCTGLKHQRPSMEKVVAVLQKACCISEKEKSLVPSFQSNESIRFR